MKNLINRLNEITNNTEFEDNNSHSKHNIIFKKIQNDLSMILNDIYKYLLNKDGKTLLHDDKYHWKIELSYIKSALNYINSVDINSDKMHRRKAVFKDLLNIYLDIVTLIYFIEDADKVFNKEIDLKPTKNRIVTDIHNDIIKLYNIIDVDIDIDSYLA